MPFHVSTSNLHPLVASLKSGPLRLPNAAEPTPTPQPFVTISRQPGAGDRFGTLLAQRLNQLQSPPLGSLILPPQWQCMDRDLVERIAQDHHLSEQLIDSLEQSSHSFIIEFLKGLHFRDDAPPSDLTIIRRLAQTTRALAQAGRVILVGHGSVFITRNMPGALHIRLIAPLDARIRNLALEQNLSLPAARRQLKLLEDRRSQFFHAYWPDTALTPDLFHLAFNTHLLTESQMANCVASLLHPTPNNPV